MKIISITEFVTESGSNKTAEIPLVNKPGLFYRVVTDTFVTPLFKIGNTDIPVIMLHSDRATFNVSVTVEDAILKISQIYQQAERGFIITSANDDWTDISEYRPIAIDAMSLDSVVLNNGNTESIVADLNNMQIRLRLGVSGSAPIYSQKVSTIDGGSYIFPITWTAHVSGTSENPVYDYHYADIPRMITVYGK